MLVASAVSGRVPTFAIGRRAAWSGLLQRALRPYRQRREAAVAARCGPLRLLVSIYENTTLPARPGRGQP